ncbi:uncharacterized protein LTR77_009262 [Saxophila tyrrhenica]|uniref:Uncharacterized protein n=1 Tax=Saxophila tyrrhenica TaxID=1690608 RepID=A0AAV9NYK4_9PEZI|nr:hypothetical protein LTR77_009262 [Saxophila tyrrhenica]
MADDQNSLLDLADFELDPYVSGPLPQNDQDDQFGDAGSRRSPLQGQSLMPGQTGSNDYSLDLAGNLSNTYHPTSAPAQSLMPHHSEFPNYHSPDLTGNLSDVFHFGANPYHTSGGAPDPHAQPALPDRVASSPRRWQSFNNWNMPNVVCVDPLYPPPGMNYHPSATPYANTSNGQYGTRHTQMGRAPRFEHLNQQPLVRPFPDQHLHTDMFDMHQSRSGPSTPTVLSGPAVVESVLRAKRMQKQSLGQPREHAQQASARRPLSVPHQDSNHIDARLRSPVQNITQATRPSNISPSTQAASPYNNTLAVETPNQIGPHLRSSAPKATRTTRSSGNLHQTQARSPYNNGLTTAPTQPAPAQTNLAPHPTAQPGPNTTAGQGQYQYAPHPSLINAQACREFIASRKIANAKSVTIKASDDWVQVDALKQRHIEAIFHAVTAQWDHSPAGCETMSAEGMKRYRKQQQEAYAKALGKMEDAETRQAYGVSQKTLDVVVAKPKQQNKDVPQSPLHIQKCSARIANIVHVIASNKLVAKDFLDGVNLDDLARNPLYVLQKKVGSLKSNGRRKITKDETYTELEDLKRKSGIVEPKGGKRKRGPKTTQEVEVQDEEDEDEDEFADEYLEEDDDDDMRSDIIVLVGKPAKRRKRSDK